MQKAGTPLEPLAPYLTLTGIRLFQRIKSEDVVEKNLREFVITKMKD